MTKKFLFSLIALVSISVVFMGCPEDASKTIAQELQKELGGSSVADVDGTTVTLKAAKTLDKNITVPSGITLTIKSGTTLTTSTYTLTVKGTLVVQGTLVAGTATVVGKSGGQVKIETGGVCAATIFYPNGAGAAAAAVAGKTYDWNATAGGAGTAGWKANS
ncbi:MAG: hypothetical protein LBO67_09025 [Spirochaetaceae bacterium]|jgi:hypothetical protein|nr:hypothetical protein [Spirochaetaceae bacterium]